MNLGHLSEKFINQRVDWLAKISEYYEIVDSSSHHGPGPSLLSASVRGLVTTAPVQCVHWWPADAAAAAARHATESCPRILSALSLCMARKQPPAHVTANTGTNYHLI